MEKLCVISMSGGLDSTTLAYKALEDGFTVLPINIEYNQKNSIEQEAFNNLFKYMKEKFGDKLLEPVKLDLTSIMKQSLAVYKQLRDSKKVKTDTGHEFYTPSRNLVFSTLAAMIGEIAAMAENLKEVKIGLGVHQHSDVYSRDYWDITPNFVSKLNEVLNLNDSMNVELYAPYVNFPKSKIVKDVKRLSIPYKLTWTCYSPIEESGNPKLFKPCLVCEACLERQKAGDEAGIKDINNYNLIQK